ncbi:MAG: polyphenol oxidase family protein [Acidimicrobiales bacterium]|nr:polyphenol oxidase family protein [Acidimicrobiales bacterium]
MAVTLPLLDGRQAHLVFTDRSHGDLGREAAATERDARRARVAPLPWTSLAQVHGSSVVEVTAPGEHADVEADAAVTTATGAVLAVHTADCAPVALIADGGAVAVVHVGWKGLSEGVVERGAGRLRSVARGPYRAVLGPCIHPECYQFSEPDLVPLVERFGPVVRSTTSAGQPALDLPAAVAVALGREAVPLVADHTACTACGGRWYSHRARGDRERQALVAWIARA